MPIVVIVNYPVFPNGVDILQIARERLLAWVFS